MLRAMFSCSTYTAINAGAWKPVSEFIGIVEWFQGKMVQKYHQHLSLLTLHFQFQNLYPPQISFGLEFSYVYIRILYILFKIEIIQGENKVQSKGKTEGRVQ